MFSGHGQKWSFPSCYQAFDNPEHNPLPLLPANQAGILTENSSGDLMTHSAGVFSNLWHGPGRPLAGIVFLVSPGLVAGNFIEAMNRTRCLAIPAAPLARTGNLSDTAGASFSITFFHPVFLHCKRYCGWHDLLFCNRMTCAGLCAERRLVFNKL